MGCSTMDAALTATAVLNGVAVLVLDKATRVYTFVSVHHIAIVTHFTPAYVVCAWLSAALPYSSSICLGTLVESDAVRRLLQWGPLVAPCH